MPRIGLERTERWNSTTENPQHSIALGKIIDLSTSPVRIDKVNVRRLQACLFQGSSHRQSRPNTFRRTRRLMVSLIGIAPADQPADSAFRVGSEHEIPRTLTQIQPCTRLVERPADFRIKNTQRIEPVHRKTAKRIRTAHNGHIAQSLTQHLGSQHNSIAGSGTSRTYGRTENYIDSTGLQIMRHHRGNIPGRMHAQTSRVTASKVIAVLLPEDLAQIHSAHRSTGQ